MNPRNNLRIAHMLQRRRRELGLTTRQVASRAGINASTVTRLEASQIETPTADVLKSVATALDLPVTDLFTTADWLPKNELPTFTPYLRSKYPKLPDSELAELETRFADIARKHGYEHAGPAPGEDEA